MWGKSTCSKVTRLAFLGCGITVFVSVPALPGFGADKVTQQQQADIERVKTTAALANCERVIDLNDQKKIPDVVKELAILRGNTTPQARDPRIEALIARLALLQKRSDIAWQFVQPYGHVATPYDPTNAPAQLVAADVLLIQNNTDLAQRLYSQVAENEHAGSRSLALAAEGIGRAKYMLGDNSGALDSFKESLDVAHSLEVYAHEHDYDWLTSRLDRELANAQRKSDVSTYGEDFVLFRDAETSRRVQQDYPRASTIYRDIIKRFPKGPFADAARLYDAMCMEAMNREAEAVAEFKSIADASPGGPFVGEANIELARIALESDFDLESSDKLLQKVEDWLPDARRDASKQTPTTRPALASIIRPPDQQETTDYFGNTTDQPISPGQLVNGSTCPWYLNDLAARAAKLRGFIYFAQGKKDQALAEYKKIERGNLDEATAEAEGRWDDYRRLKWGADHGYLIAYPEELQLYTGRPRVAVLLADFYFCTRQFARSESLAHQFLAGEFGRLSPAQQAYPHYLMGIAIKRVAVESHGADESPAVAELEKALALPGTSVTKARSALAIATVARYTSDKKLSALGMALMRQLAASPDNNEFTWTARVELGRELVEAGHRDEGMKALREIPESAGQYHELAAYFIKFFTTHSTVRGPDGEMGTG
jgi:tetratricopeptide (TPR) repeat protein